MIFFATYKVSALNSARILNQLQESGIVLKKIEKKSDGLHFSVGKKYVASVEKTLAERGIAFEKTQENSCKQFGKNVLQHFALCVCLIVIAAGLWTASLFYFSIEINCTNNQLQAEVFQLLANNNIKPNRPKAKVQPQNVARLVLSSVDRVAFAEARYCGAKLVVDVIEQHMVDGYPESKTQIFASCDCIVTRVIVTSGTAQVKEGDSVKKGQILIDGYIDLGDPADPNNIRQPVKASGQIFGRTWAQASANVSSKYIVAERTGQSVEYTDLELFGWRWNGKKDINFASWERETKSSAFGVFFPIKYSNHTIFETKLVEKETTQTDLDNKTNEMFVELAQTLPKGSKLLKSWNLQKRVDNLYVLDIYYELEQDIAC
ncbi:MAG: sporulation protein YqfD [Clostridia bacterium]